MVEAGTGCIRVVLLGRTRVISASNSQHSHISGDQLVSAVDYQCLKILNAYL